MATEIERKFLVDGEDWRAGARGVRLKQGYLSTDPARSVRVRLAGEAAWLTVKGQSAGIARQEFEYAIPAEDAEQLFALCLPGMISKTRYRVRVGAHDWDIDEFHGANDGLLLAEIELDRDDEAFDRPRWLGEEVSDDPRYFNAALVENPYCRWKDAD